MQNSAPDVCRWHGCHSEAASSLNRIRAEREGAGEGEGEGEREPERDGYIYIYIYISSGGGTAASIASRNTAQTSKLIRRFENHSKIWWQENRVTEKWFGM